MPRTFSRQLHQPAEKDGIRIRRHRHNMISLGFELISLPDHLPTPHVSSSQRRQARVGLVSAPSE